ncbi:manganese efflux pump MntP [Alicyclobacillus dauci]|uniref:Manganese efflux pump n=1 Tax=Alicyclobacillus dauci TaxID=1475485 RepID=A0ABY6Z2Y4_9BACL|nr:manganese efflux pump [Alicyclobacillus dauci]WAH37201.1 manganese efflux pump [Alicyclobacillus dauci]
MFTNYEEVIELFFLTLTLGIDVFFVGASLGTGKVSSRSLKLFLIYVGVFHLLFSFAGITVGTYLHMLMGDFSEILGGIIIISTGFFFLVGTIRDRKENEVLLQSKTVSLAFAVSTECFSTGIGVSMHLHIILAILFAFTFVGVVSGYLGIRLGRKIGNDYGLSGSFLGSICLVAVGCLFLVW